MLGIIYLLQFLGIAVVINILLGTYYNISIKDIKFDKFKLLDGIYKAILICGSFIGLAYIFDNVSLGDLSVNPKLIMMTAIGFYVAKDIVNLTKVLKIKVADKVKDIISSLGDNSDSTKTISESDKTKVE